MSKWDNQKTEDLSAVILQLKNKTEAKKFLRDLLTEAELREFGNRWRAVQMLAAKIPYTEIIKETGLSSTTVARISRWLQKGQGGYKLMLQRTKRHHHHNSHSSRKRLC